MLISKSITSAKTIQEAGKPCKHINLSLSCQAVTFLLLFLMRFWPGSSFFMPTFLTIPGDIEYHADAMKPKPPEKPDSWIANHIDTIYDKLTILAEAIAALREKLIDQSDKKHLREHNRKIIFLVLVIIGTVIITLSLIFHDQLIPFLNSSAVQQGLEMLP